MFLRRIKAGFHGVFMVFKENFKLGAGISTSTSACAAKLFAGNPKSRFNYNFLVPPVRKAIPAVVHIVTDIENEEVTVPGYAQVDSVMIGSGFIVDKRGFIIIIIACGLHNHI